MAKKVKSAEPVNTGFKWGFAQTITSIIVASLAILVWVFIYSANVVPAEIKASEVEACKGMQADIQVLAPDAKLEEIIRVYLAAATRNAPTVDTRSDLSLHMQLLSKIDPTQAAIANTEESFRYDQSISEVNKMCLEALK
ncbi:hypothetical protein [Rhodoluna sp.]|uniref:hypothetical protein n=1 Tax=Rhodoluna sp. TaxID=1969481 RepID=UPI0025E19BDE|nr:hypothetical protein [Rhodoluna sp.]